MAKNEKTQVENFADEAQKTVSENVEKMARGMEEATQFGQQNVDAVVASSKIAAKAAESVGAEIAAYTKKSYEDGLAAAKEMSTSKSVSELIEKQTAYTKTFAETWLSEATKINEIATAAFKDASEPLSARFTAAVDAVKSVRA